MAGHRYDPQEIEPRWQALWARERTWEVSGDSAADGRRDDIERLPKSYVLEMLPYPSGEPHIGHLKCYSVGDAIAHFHRRTGHRVLHPMGYDAFGLPAENHAIKTGVHPRDSTAESIASFQRQFRSWGISIDWSRELGTHEPSYYRWTQWIFLQLFEAGLAYRRDAAVKWCPNDQTVLANEQVVDGCCERCGYVVERRNLSQWNFKITDYADRLLAGIDRLEGWPERIKTMQRNWIGRSEGATFSFDIEHVDARIDVFTTRVDTAFGVTFMAIAPEHPIVAHILAALPEGKARVEAFAASLASKSELERTQLMEKTGVPTGAYAINPLSGTRVPIWVTNYVLAEYGTGAVMGVPAHDDRDFDFAKKHELPIAQVVVPGEGTGEWPDGEPAEAF